jgi:hypothetical protein
MNRGGLGWSDITGQTRDPMCAMGTVLLIMGLEWIVFLIFSLYLDQARESDRQSGSCFVAHQRRAIFRAAMCCCNQERMLCLEPDYESQGSNFTLGHLTWKQF